jgi:hypothetical protein
MECSCFDIEVDGDSIMSSIDEIAEANQGRKCTECGRKIRYGEEYRFEVGAFEGDYEVYKTCLDCNSLREVLLGSFYYGNIRDGIRECVVECGGRINLDKLSELTVAAREWICELVEQQWEEWEDEE